MKAIGTLVQAAVLAALMAFLCGIAAGFAALGYRLVTR